MQATSYDDLTERLLALDASLAERTDLLAQAMEAANMAGRFDITQEAD